MRQFTNSKKRHNAWIIDVYTHININKLYLSNRCRSAAELVEGAPTVVGVKVSHSGSKHLQVESQMALY